MLKLIIRFGDTFIQFNMYVCFAFNATSESSTYYKEAGGVLLASEPTSADGTARVFQNPEVNTTKQRYWLSFNL